MRVDLREGPGANPLVLVGGMTQTLSSWGGQTRPLSQDTTVFAYEARGQGQTELPLSPIDFGTHADDLAALLEALHLEGQVDLAGFSFGGRVALAFAALHPGRVRRLVLTGVADDRGVIGRLITQGWAASLATGDLEALARITLPDILGPDYLTRHEAMLEPMVKAVAQRNRYEGIAALFEATLNLPQDSPFTAARLAAQVEAPSLCIAGELDRLAPPSGVASLAEQLGGESVVVAGVGHTVPIEAPDAWRGHVRTFLGYGER